MTYFYMVFQFFAAVWAMFFVVTFSISVFRSLIN